MDEKIRKAYPDFIQFGYRNRFPTLAVILVIVGVIWLLNELEVFHIKIPWVPIIVIVVGMGMIINRYRRKF